jgi:heme-degrading monooxygenase HmoA
MSVKIIIERKFKEPPFPENIRLINRLRIGAMRQKGYISGETLVNLEDNKEIIVISSWSHIDEWYTWSKGQERIKLEKELERFLVEPAKLRVYKLGADAIMEAFQNFVYDAQQSTKR